VIVTADHGEAFGGRGLFLHGVSVYQNQVHVPLLVKYPGQTQPARVETPVSLLDVMPTVLAVAGLDGRAAQRPRPALAESFPGARLYRMKPRFHRIQRAVVDGDLELLVATNGRHELYDLSRDPEELDDRYDAQLAKPLEAELEGFLAEPAARRMAPHTDAETQARLRALGYAN
jgi:choline-sulfatase